MTALLENEPHSRWGWAAYLGASWTWCIGMFLPVLLIRDYGPWAWLLFAVPNVVGAAAMGWVMRTTTMSRHYVVDHAGACRLFSLVTIAFQLFFAVWMLPHLIGPAGYVGAAILVQSAFTPLTDFKTLRWGGAIALAISALMAIGLLTTHALAWPWLFSMAAGDAAGLGLVCLLGFLTCPYLDLTFHRARLATSDRDAKFAFGVGFGVFFLRHDRADVLLRHEHAQPARRRRVAARDPPDDADDFYRPRPRRRTQTAGDRARRPRRDERAARRGR